MKEKDKRDRDRHTGQFVLKDDDFRKVRSVRLTDEAWAKLGACAEALNLTRGDLLEDWGRYRINNLLELPTATEPELEEGAIIITKEELESMIDKALKQLKVDKQASLYKGASLGFKKLISLMFPH